MQCNTAPYIIGHRKHRPCKNRAETVHPWLTKQKSHEIFRFTASTVDIPTRWNPRAKQQPTGLIACGAMRRRPVRAPFHRADKKKNQNTNVFWFFLVHQTMKTEPFLNRRRVRIICFLRKAERRCFSNRCVSETLSEKRPYHKGHNCKGAMRQKGHKHEVRGKSLQIQHGHRLRGTTAPGSRMHWT